MASVNAAISNLPPPQINAFYLQKEAELKLRLTTLLSKRRAAASRVLPDSDEMELAKDHVEWGAVIEGFTLLQNDLLKLQVGLGSYI